MKYYRCKIELIGACMICKVCWQEWPRGMGFSEYVSITYDPPPKVIPPGVGTCEEAPPE